MLLTRQLDAPSFAVPIIHPSKHAAKAFVQALFVPCHCSGDSLSGALKQLSEEDRILPILKPVERVRPLGLAYVLVIRPDDPALIAACVHQSRDAEPVGAA